MPEPGDIVIHRPVVWVVGASRGIGREIARQFASIGCEVCLSGRNRQQLRSAVKEIVTLGGRACDFPLDITRPASIPVTVSRIEKNIGEIDVVVLNAGVTVFKSYLKTSLKEFDTIIDTNLSGLIRCVKAVLPSMVKRKSGWIINISSNAAVKTFEESAAYTATKAGFLHAMKVLREEMKPFNVKVVNVLPGPTETEMWSTGDRKKYSRRMMRAKSVAETVLAIYQLPEDVVVDEIIIRPMKGDIE